MPDIPRSSHRALHSSLAMLATIALARSASADDAPNPSSELAAASDGDTNAAPTETAVVTTADAPPAARYPRAVIARPLTLPSGLAVFGADATANHDVSVMGGAPIVGYGITDKLELQVPYAFATRDFEAKGQLDLDVGYAVLRGALGGKLEAIARIRGGYDLLASHSRPLLIGLHAQYNVTDKLAIISGVPGSQQLRISLAKDAAMARPVDFTLPLGIGLQATGALYLQLDTKLAQLEISESANTLIFRDATPVALTAVYNVVNAVDVQIAVGTDLSNAPGDALTFLVGARYYAGRL